MPTPDERLDRLIEALGTEAARGMQAGGGTEETGRAGEPPGPPPRPGRVREGTAADAVPLGRHRPGRIPLLSLPSSLHGARLGVSTPVLRGVVVLVAVLAVVLGVRVAWAERSATPRPVSAPGNSADLGAATTTAPPVLGSPQSSASVPSSESVANSAVSATSAPQIVLHVIGAVRDPGIVSLAPGSRVHDAVEGAGGLSERADLSRLNLARPAVDGERLWVPVPGEEPPPELPAPPLPVPTSAAPGAGSSDGAAGDDTVVDLNTADQTELETLPGVGPVTAERILAWREEHSAFSTVEELLEVSGIGERTLEQLRPHVGLGP
ncbi:MAG: helix-hairpin-helix domain-containing protein [Ornithinimicrobium sp.]|uniref:helix-hairpin-helix domain-containing protein n=1 Tax=Ornithinimicrobium sp. TaxID=1977084 RepID=UPI003D9B276E